MKKFLSHFLNLICILMVALAVVVLACVLFAKTNNKTSIMGYSLYRVLTPSMEPAIMTNSVIVVKEAEASELNEGDIITFWSRDPSISGSTNTHRIVAIDESAGYPVFTTKGDNNYVDDEYKVYPEDIVGRVVFVSYGLGAVLSFISNPICFAILVIVPLAIIFILNVKDLIVTAKKLEQQEIEEAVKNASSGSDPSGKAACEETSNGALGETRDRQDAGEALDNASDVEAPAEETLD